MANIAPRADAWNWRRTGARAVVGLLPLPALGLLALAVLTFLGEPAAPSMIVADVDGRLGRIEVDQFKAIIDKPMSEYIAWSQLKEREKKHRALYHRRVFRLDNHDHSLFARGGLDLFSKWDVFAGSPASAAYVEALDFGRRNSVVAAQKTSIWGDTTRKTLTSPIRFLAGSAGNANSSDNKLHIARIPPRAARPKNVGHVKPDSHREAVWLKSIPLPRLLANAKANQLRGDAESPASRARPLHSGAYLVGWLFVITHCDDPGGCKLTDSAEAGCLKPETLTDHVLGMTPIVIPRSVLYPSKSKEETDAQREMAALGSAILNGSGLVLLTGADYDYVSLRVSHYPAGGRQPSNNDETGEESSLSEAESSQTREASIAMLEERLHEILTSINRTDDLNDGDLVAILPTALDVSLGEEDYLIAGFGKIPPPLRSHFRASGASTSTAKSPGSPALEISEPSLVGPAAQVRRPAARMRAAVDE